MSSAGSTSSWGTSVFGGIGSQVAQPGGGNLLSMNYLNNCTPAVGGRRKRKKSIKKCKSRRRRTGKTRCRRRRR